MNYVYKILIRYMAIITSQMMIVLVLSSAAYANASADPIREVTVKGKVTGSDNETLPGVSIVEKGTTNGTTTDADGVYNITVSGPDAILVFSYIGFTNEEVVVGTRTTIDVSLIPDMEALSEVVVVGYNTAKKSDVTGAITRVDEQELRSRPVMNAMEAVQGKAAGVDITSNERPGEIGQVRIRGVRSLTASNNPLYVVDGIPLMSESGIETLNPLDIESIDILKDASATAVYGSRGANGVVIVTTKKGKAGKMTVNYSGSTIIETLEDRTKMMSAPEYIEWRRWAYYYADPVKNPRGDQPNIEFDKQIFNASKDPSAWKNIAKGWEGGAWDGSKVATTNWGDMVKQTAVTHNHTLSVSGGTDKIKAYASFGYLDNPGTLKGQGYKRYSTRVSVDISPTKWFDMGININGSFSNQQYGTSTTGGAASGSRDIYRAAMAVFPYAVPYDSLGNRIDFPGGDDLVKNIVNEWEYNDNERKMLRAIGSFYAQVKLLPGLRYRVNFGPDFRNFRNGVFVDQKSINRINQPNYVYLANQNDFSWTLDNLLFYDKAFGNHTIGATLLQTTSKWIHTEDSVSGFGVAAPSQKWNALGTLPLTTNVSMVASDLVERQLMSYMGRIAYGFKERYQLTASGRWDGASQLSEGHKWAFFPSAALAWTVSSEPWMAGINAINQLKLRVGVGTTGNSSINPYGTQPRAVPLYYPFGGSVTPGYSPSESLISGGDLPMANPNLTWEKTTQYNLGIDYSILNNRVSGVLDFYTSHTKDLLMRMTIPSVTGYTRTFENVGETKNIGADITLNTLNLKVRDFEWHTSINAGWQKDEIVKLSLGKQDDINNNWFIGESLNVLYGFESGGIWKEEDAEEMALFKNNNFQAGKARPVDRNGDKVIDPGNDRSVIGHTRPRWTLGVNNSFRYKGFDLSMLIYGRLDYTYPTNLGEAQLGRYNQRSIDYYNENNKDSEFQKPIFNVSGADVYYQTLGYRSGSFLKIRNINLGYTFANATLSKLQLQSLRLYAQVRNPGMLYSAVDWLDLDLESSTFNRGFVFGLDVSF
jgi:TonB-dependent starch-binding outer membrane protein SusC